MIFKKRFFLLFIVALGSILFLFAATKFIDDVSNSNLNQKQAGRATQPPGLSVAKPAPTSSSTSNSLLHLISASQSQQEGNIYVDKNVGFTLNYPLDAQATTTDEGSRIDFSLTSTESEKYISIYSSLIATTSLTCKTAQLPKTVLSDVHYFSGMPFYKTESTHESTLGTTVTYTSISPCIVISETVNVAPGNTVGNTVASAVDTTEAFQEFDQIMSTFHFGQ